MLEWAETLEVVEEVVGLVRLFQIASDNAMQRERLGRVEDKNGAVGVETQCLQNEQVASEEMKAGKRLDAHLTRQHGLPGRHNIAAVAFAVEPYTRRYIAHTAVAEAVMMVDTCGWKHDDELGMVDC